MSWSPLWCFRPDAASKTRPRGRSRPAARAGTWLGAFEGQTNLKNLKVQRFKASGF